MDPARLGSSSEPLRIGDVAVADAPVRVETSLESLSDGVRVRARVEFSWRGPCRRCLSEASGSASAELRELYVDDPEDYAATAELDEDDTDSTPRPIGEGWIDLAEAVRETVLLELPLAPLCDESCEGPDPGSNPVTVESDTDPAGDDAGAAGGADPRWAALSELRFDPEQDQG
ncbi:MAG: DUF177 domain-containing protein [Microthrixaceae bacterium]|nr:DUF177 domain-containing protein [Microthrixaceae bacterium]